MPDNRTKLKDKIPLDTPYVVQVFPIYGCNNKCHYCLFSTPERDRPFITHKKVMAYELFRKLIYQIKDFDSKLKVLRFVGIGEPLLHPEIVKMVKFAKGYNIAESIELLTNGKLLEEKMSMKLNEAGLDKVIISLQEVPDNNIVDNIKSSYCHKPMKTIVKAFNNNYDYVLFPYCDEMRYENIVPLHKDTGIKTKTQYGNDLEEFKVCPQPFYHLQVNPDGLVVPCYNWEYPAILGDINKDHLYSIWTSRKMNKFRLKCKAGKCMCNMAKYRYRKEDNIG